MVIRKTANQTGTGYRVGEIENTNVSWEEATKVNAGIELRLFEKLKIQADYFMKNVMVSFWLVLGYRLLSALLLLHM